MVAADDPAMIELHPQIINRDGREAFAVLPWDEFVKLREMLDDARDLRDLEIAIRENEGQTPRPYDQVRGELGLTES